jgi:VanZ family protein
LGGGYNESALATDRSHLPDYLAAAYALLIVYASLGPFVGWTSPAHGTRFFLWDELPRLTLADLAINVVAYVPLGFFLALRYRAPVTPVRVQLTATLAAFVLSLIMESLQTFLPARVASTADLAGNTLGGALGALPGLAVLRHPEWRARLAAWRDRTFTGGRAGDLGLALLGLWLLVQVNPAIPLFSATYAMRPGSASGPADTLLEAGQSLFNVIGVGLFVALLLRRREHIGGAVLTLLGACVMLKGLAAALLLKPSFWEHWLGAGSARGVAIGAIALLALIWLPRRAQSVLCSVALLSALGITLLAPDLLFADAPLAQFSWSYGQLLNFNGLTRTAALAWPVVASTYLFALAGRGPGEQAQV